MTTQDTGTAGGADDLDLFEAEATGKPVTKDTSTAIPDKYVGKNTEDLIRMHQNAEKKISEQGREVSTLRRLADEVIGLKKATTQTTEERKPVTVEALLNDPEKAIRDAVAASDVGKRADSAEARVDRLESQLTEQSFVSKHKNFAADISDPEFVDWVNKNLLRQALAADLASSSKTKYTSATNLWDMWEEHRELLGSKPTTRDAPKADATNKKVPATVRSSPNSNVKAKPNYSRAKVMEFKMKVQAGDPSALARWNDPTFQTNLNDAYAEDRVI